MGPWPTYYTVSVDWVKLAANGVSNRFRRTKNTLTSSTYKVEGNPTITYKVRGGTEKSIVLDNGTNVYVYKDIIIN